jgi:hypothetical protein
MADGSALAGFDGFPDEVPEGRAAGGVAGAVDPDCEVGGGDWVEGVDDAGSDLCRWAFFATEYCAAARSITAANATVDHGCPRMSPPQRSM